VIHNGAQPTAVTQGARVASQDELYLDLLAQVLTRTIDMEHLVPAPTPVTKSRRAAFRLLNKALAKRGMLIARETTYDKRAAGWDWPRQAETMVGLARLENVRQCVTDVIRCGVPGDLLEAGVWRGGVGIYMRAILAASGDTTRKVWLADSFQGLPPPSGNFEADIGDKCHRWPELAVSLDDVKHNFERYGLLDDQVEFLPGWFNDTLPSAPVDTLAVLRCDGDMYESTIVTLESLYPKVSPGGYVIVDDYGALPQCKAAVDDFRAQHRINDRMESVDWTGVYWRRNGT